MNHPVLSVSADSTAYDALMGSNPAACINEKGQPAKYPKVIGSKFLWANGEKSISQLERPCLHPENGMPRFLYGVTLANKELTLTVNVAVPLGPLKETSTDLRVLIQEAVSN